MKIIVKIIVSINCLLIMMCSCSKKVNPPEETCHCNMRNLKPIETVTDELGRTIDKETKALRVNRNEYFKTESKEANEIALSFLQEKSEMYGLSNNLNDTKIAKIAESPAGQYVYCIQYVNDIPVFSTNFTIFINKENIVTYALNEFRNVAKYKDVASSPSIANSEALIIAHKCLNIQGDVIGEPKTELVYFESIDKGLELAWKININAMNPMGDWQIFINAIDKRIIQVENIAIT